MTHKINYQFYYWGPLLCKFKLTKDEIKKLIKLCKKDKKLDKTKDLSAVIKHEYEINILEFHKIICPYLSIYYEQIYPNYYGKKPEQKLQCNTAWVNYMAPGEVNPPHVHTGCNFSSVIYLKIPAALKKEKKQFLGTGVGPGAIQFIYGSTSDKAINQVSPEIEEGDFFIFPHNLFHFVTPYKSKGERISIAANFV